jgi:CheY-like chemotaxis protein
MGQARQQKSRAVLIVEDDAEVRMLAATLLEDEHLNTIECESAEAALAIMLIGGREVAMIFADVRLPGVMDEVDLAWEVKLRWPLLPVILTSGLPRERVGDLPFGPPTLEIHLDFKDAYGKAGAKSNPDRPEAAAYIEDRLPPNL